MPVIQINNIEKILGDRMLFEGLSFSIEKGERVGLIGNNGEGKTTLFRTIVGEITPDVGDVAVPRGTKIGYLRQEVDFTPGNTLIDEAELAFSALHDISHAMRDIEHKMADAQGDALDKLLSQYEKLQHDFGANGGYAWQHRLEATLLGVGLEREVWETLVDKLSGGQRSRLALAKILIAEPDLLLLDEPTNHLDLVAIEWLEDYLLAYNGAVLLISHDRYLLDRLCTRVAWLTGRKLKTYPGNFTAFLEQKAVEELSQARAHELQQKDIAKQQEFIRRFSAGQRAREAQGRAKKLGRLLESDAIVDAVQTRRSMAVRFGNDARAGDQLLRVAGLKKTFDARVIWDDLTFNVKPGERIGIIGPNGSGKTTLLKTLLGQLEADVGDVRWGTNLSIGYYDQRLDEFDPDNSILEEVHDGMIPEKQVRDLLGSLLFTGDSVDKRMGDLSGGERARVALAQLMLEKPNVILLDEPTNHLDLQSVEALEKTLGGFDGTLLMVSHDRYFLQRIVERLFVLDPPTMEDFEGGFDAWHDREAMRKAAAAAKSAGRTSGRGGTSGGNSSGSSRSGGASKSSNIKTPSANAGSGGSTSNSTSTSTGTGTATASATRLKGGSTTKATGRPKDNPYAREFGRLTVKEVEARIHEAETEIGMLQLQLAEPRAARDAALAKRLNADLLAASARLKGLEEEYFLREA